MQQKWLEGEKAWHMEKDWWNWAYLILKSDFSNYGLLSSGLFLKGLEGVSKESKFLYTLELSTYIISLKKLCTCKRAYLGSNAEVRDSKPLLLCKEDSKGPSANFQVH